MLGRQLYGTVPYDTTAAAVCTSTVQSTRATVAARLYCTCTNSGDIVRNIIGFCIRIHISHIMLCSAQCADSVQYSRSWDARWGLSKPQFCQPDCKSREMSSLHTALCRICFGICQDSIGCSQLLLACTFVHSSIHADHPQRLILFFAIICYRLHEDERSWMVYSLNQSLLHHGMAHFITQLYCKCLKDSWWHVGMRPTHFVHELCTVLAS